jgi:integrase
MKAKITLKLVNSLGLGEKVSDTECIGFRVRRQKGDARVYSVSYRHQGVERQYTIGRHGSPWVPDTARKQARAILTQVAAGKDPSGEKQAYRSAPTLSDLAARFLAEHAGPKCKASSAKEYKRLLDHVILPTLGAKKAADVTRRDVELLHHAFRQSPYQSNRAVGLLSSLMNMAEKWGMRPDGSNPTRHIVKFKQANRERFLSADEFARLADAISAYGGSLYIKAAIRLLALTGCRRNEITTLRWQEVDLDNGELRLSDSKTGAKVVFLGEAAVAILTSLPHVHGNDHVFPGRHDGEHLGDFSKAWVQIRKAAGLDGVRLHDLRHSYASMGINSNLSLAIVGKLLGHTQPSTTSRYAHLASNPLKIAAADISSRIDAAMHKLGQE